MGSGGSKGHESFAVAPGVVITHAQPADPSSAPADTVADHPPAAAPLSPPEPPADPPAPPSPEPPPAGDPAPLDEPATAGEITPIPSELPAGLAVGTPLLAGAGDLVDDTVRLTHYLHADTGIQHLSCHVDPDSEGKLLAALATTAPTTTIQTTKEINGRLPLDETQQTYERTVTAVKSVNHHLKAGDAIPEHTVTLIEQLHTELSAVTSEAATADETAMATHYLASVTELKQRVETPLEERPPYAGPGGKVGQINPYEVTSTVTVTETVPDLSKIPLGQRPTTIQAATRIKPTFDADTGTAAWNGVDRTPASGKEYVIDLGDGYTARYRPHTTIGSAPTEYSQRGHLEITAPPDAGAPAALVGKLATLNLGHRPLTAQEAEWTYLRRQVTAQGLSGHPDVANALAQAPDLDVAMQHVLMSQRAHQAVGMTEEQLHHFAAAIATDASHAALPTKVQLLRSAVASATGHDTPAALLASRGYRPTPQISGGWLTWSRFDIADNLQVAHAFEGRRLTHNVHSAAHLTSMFSSGVLAATERRAEMGLPTGMGMSEGTDKLTGGAQSVFLRATSAHPSGVCLVWNTPHTLLSRADWYAYNGDHFGADNPDSTKYNAKQLTRDPYKVAGFSASNNEIMFRNGIDLLGNEAPDQVRCATDATRTAVLTTLKNKGISHIKGRPVEEVITL